MSRAFKQAFSLFKKQRQRLARAVVPMQKSRLREDEMRNRKLTHEEAIEEYVIYRLRTCEFLRIFQIALDIIDDTYKPRDPLGHGAGEFIGNLRAVSAGLFASLIDKHTDALNVFDVWLALFPGKKDRIDETWRKIEPQIDLIRDHRNHIAFHANKDPGVYFETYYRFKEKSAEITTAMQEFWKLAVELMNDEGNTLPDLRKEIEPVLKKIEAAIYVVNKKTLSETEREELKDYFIPR
jgi:hypothetical protein